MMLTIRRVMLNIQLWGLVLFGLFLAYGIWSQHDEAVTVGSPHLLSDRLVPGGIIQVATAFVDQRSCATQVGRFLWRPRPDLRADAREEWLLQDSPTAVAGVGATLIVLDLSVPAAITPGAWFYYSRAERSCGLFGRLFGPEITRTRDAPVNVVASP